MVVKDFIINLDLLNLVHGVVCGAGQASPLQLQLWYRNNPTFCDTVKWEIWSESSDQEWEKCDHVGEMCSQVGLALKQCQDVQHMIDITRWDEIISIRFYFCKNDVRCWKCHKCVLLTKHVLHEFRVITMLTSPSPFRIIVAQWTIERWTFVFKSNQSS